MNQNFFIRNRQSLMDATHEAVAIFAGNKALQRANDASYAFQQEANFWYLTGIDAANWQVIIEPDATTLVAPDVDEIHRIFDGSLLNENALRISGAQSVISYAEGKKKIEALMSQYKSVASLGEDPYVSHYDFSLNPGPVECYELLHKSFVKVVDVRKVLAKLRAIKQPEEIAMIRRAIDVTIDAFEQVKQSFASYKTEYELEAEFTYDFRKAGADGHAYDPIVAKGKNACTLHYVKNQDAIEPGSFVLMDIGASYNHYAADITRTYANGDVSDRQKKVHAAVQVAHEKIIALLKPGLSLKEYSASVDEIMKQSLDSLGLLKKSADYRKYFPHAISHGLGIDVHDALGAPATLQPGMILTVEPGIYIPEESIGVRIEDDILITQEGHENLSARLSTDM